MPRAPRRYRLPALVSAAAIAGFSAFAAIGPASAAGPVNYVALGDSYSSGDGAGSYSDGSCLQSANAYPVDVTRYFSGHQICDSGSYLISVDWLNLGDSYHPKASGQKNGYLPALISVTG